MHIEDRLTTLEQHDNRNTECLSRALNTMQNHSNNIERMLKRLESTEVQIHKLFAITDELRPKVIHIDSLNETDKASIIKTIQIQDTFKTKEIFTFREDKQRGDLNHWNIKCNNCNNASCIDKSYGTRRVRMDKGNIVEIAYEFKCLKCKQPIIIYL